MDQRHCFKTCTCCGKSWDRHIDFFADPAVTFVGYQHFYSADSRGLLLFNHSCGTTFSIDAAELPRWHDRIAPPGPLRDNASSQTCLSLSPA